MDSKTRKPRTPKYEIQTDEWKSNILQLKDTKTGEIEEEAEIRHDNIDHTCSMDELTQFPSDELNNMINKAGLKAVKEAFNDIVIDMQTAFIYNTNSRKGTIEYSVLEKLGFKKVFSYEGNEGVVNTFMRENK